jgi:hypothetical protein
MAGLDGCGKLDITEISQDNIVSIGNLVWVKADVEEKIWIYQGLPCTVIKFDDACFARMCTDKDAIPRSLLMGVEHMEMLDCGGGQEPPAGSGSIDDGYTRKANTIRPEVVAGDNKKRLEQARTAVDIRSINALGFQGTAVIPSAAVIPMMSNIKTYGPYTSTNFGSSCGGTRVEVNTDLAPWIFGSVAGMNGAGESIVESTAIGLTKAETGGITIPGLPVSTFTQLGVALGSGGATLSGMNFTYGSGGISTSYQFQTYTPKFGSLNRHLIDSIKDISRNRTEQIKFLRSQQILINKTNRKIQRFQRKFGGGNKNDAANNRPSLQRILVGEIYNWQNSGQRTVIGVDSMHGSVAEMTYDFEKKAYISWDHFFGPISKKGDGNLPRYASFKVGQHKTSSEDPVPPFAISSGEQSDSFASGLNQYNLEITQQYVDPLTNNFSVDGHHHDGPGRGHVTDLIGRSSEVPQQGLITNFYRLDDDNRYAQDYRLLAMRGPILLHSWGYDTQGKPIPNNNDIEEDTKKGKFKSENLKDQFLKDWLGKPVTWPVAPIDFRFDRKRGVWVTPPGYKVVVVELTEQLYPYGTAKAKLINKDTEQNKEFGPKLFDKDGQEIKATQEDDTQAVVKVVERLGQKYSSGTRAYSYYDTFSSEYIILEAKQKQSIRFRIIDLCQATPAQPDYGDMWTKYAGYGDKFPNNHILGVRINCEGDAIDNEGNLINYEDILSDDPEKRKSVFVNLYDTCGQFGAAYASFDVNGGYNAYNEWKQKAATGFGLLCDPQAENTCSLGKEGAQCSVLDPQYESYDIIFLDHYSRFVECELTQKLYSEYNDYPNDEYKTMDPEGNAAATILQYYGDPGNGKEPKFYRNNNGGLQEIEFRVFDPFKETDKDRNPFAKLNYGDRVLAVFDENRKKYVIYNSLKAPASEVVKFALVQDKGSEDLEVMAVLVNSNNIPITTDQREVIKNQQEFNNNLIVVRDPFTKDDGNIRSRLGPALGSNKFNEHINGIDLKDNDYDNELVFPFVGFAVKRPSPVSTSSESTSTDGIIQFVYEIITLEHYAKFISGKIASIKPIDGLYLGARLYHTDGVVPIHRGTEKLGTPNIQLEYDQLNFNGVHSYIVGDVVEQGGSGTLDSMIDGCRFIATLDPQYSATNKLIYRIIEAEHLALNGKILIKDYAAGDDINSDKDEKGAKQGLDDTKIESEYSNGFMWDKNKSPTKYENIRIRTKCGWVGQAKVTVGSCLETLISGLEDNGSPLYQTISATTIAQVGEKLLTDISLPGLFGHTNFPEDERKIKTNDYFYEGVGPNLINNEDQRPKFQLTPGQQWMSFAGSKVVGIWDETTGPNIADAKYRILYVEEAPVIISCRCSKDFKPFITDNISVEPILASSNGKNAAPIVNLLGKVENPLGYGAMAGDLVTVQRVFTGVAANQANYKYIVIGTGKPPR